MIPLIFSMSIVMFPGVVASYFADPNNPGFADTIVRWFTPNTSPAGFYWIAYFVLSVGFTFFYTMITYQQQDLPGTLQKQGGFIPGIRPGKNTAAYNLGRSALLRICRHHALLSAIGFQRAADTAFFTRHVDCGRRDIGYDETAGSSAGNAAL
jgi:hypothetical protein